MMYYTKFSKDTFSDIYRLEFLDKIDNSILIEFNFTKPNKISKTDSETFFSCFTQNKDYELRIYDDMLLILEEEYCILDSTQKGGNLILKLVKNESLFHTLSYFFSCID